MLRLPLRRLFVVTLLLSLALMLAIQPLHAQDGVNIRWSLEGITDLPSLDPAKASDSQGFTVIGLLYGGLVRLDGDLHVVPDLAESWTVSDDGLTYTFALRQDSAFSDGSPITAQDVIWSLTHALDPNTGGWTGPFYLSNIAGANEVAAGTTTDLTGAVAVDDHTVALTILQPSAYFLSQLTFGSAKIVSSAQAAADPTGWENAPVTSGPYQVQEWNHGQNIVLVPNANYYQAPSASITMPFIQDSETAYQLFRTGELDIMGSQQNGIPAVHVAEMQSTPDFRSTSLFAVRYVGFNNTVAPFDNVDVRRAFALAIDKQTLASQVLQDTVVPTDRILPLGIPASELPVEGLSFDPAAAQAALAAAGVTPETIGPVTLTYGVEGDNERVVTVLQAMWQENLGVSVTLEPLELTTFSARLNETVQNPGPGGLQFYYSVWGADYPDPQNFLSQQLRTGVGNNNGHWSNAEFDALVDQADVLTGDVEQRLALYNQAEQIAVSEVGWLPLYNPRLNILVSPAVQGIVFNGQGLVIPDYSAFTLASS
ncbi:MAG: peptide ABC transporter substrate-binding protein [Anaerolineae bacterium]